MRKTFAVSIKTNGTLNVISGQTRNKQFAGMANEVSKVALTFCLPFFCTGWFQHLESQTKGNER